MTRGQCRFEWFSPPPVESDLCGLTGLDSLPPYWPFQIPQLRLRDVRLPTRVDHTPNFIPSSIIPSSRTGVSFFQGRFRFVFRSCDMIIIPIEVIATWPAPNYINPVRRGPELWIVSCIFLSIATLCVGARLYSRIFIRRWFGADDALIIIAYARLLPCPICLFDQASNRSLNS